MAGSSQKFIARNRAPRVQIEYDVELYGAEKKVQLPFVMGVMSDLAGKSEVDQGSVHDRKFLEIDVDNFDERMRGIAPRAAFTVPNTLTGEGNMAIDLTFEKMSDFEPGAIAARTEALRPLLEARQQLTNLMTYMDGKAGAEALIEKVLGDTALLGALAADDASRSDEQDAALAALRAANVPQEQEKATTDATLDALRTREIEETPADDGSAALDALRSVEVVEQETPDLAGAALDALRAVEVPEEEETDDAAGALDALRAVEVSDDPSDNDLTDDVLSGLDAPTEVAETDNSQEVLSGLKAPEKEADTDTSDAVLAALEMVEDPPKADDIADTLATLDAPKEAPQTDLVGATLAGLERPVEEEGPDTTADVLAGIEAVEDAPETDDVSATLAQLETPQEAPQTDLVGAALAGLQAPDETPELDNTNDVLAGLDAVEVIEDAPDITATLAGIESVEPIEETDTADDILAGLEAVDDVAPTDDMAAALDGLEAPVPQKATETTADVLAGIEAPEPEVAPSADLDDVLSAIEEVEAEQDKNTTQDVLAALDAPDDPSETDDIDALLADLEAPQEEVPETDTAEILSGLESIDVEEADTGNDDILAGLEAPDEATDEDTSDDVLAGLDAPDVEQETDDAEDILAGLDAPEESSVTDDLEATLASLEAVTDVEEEDDLDVLLADLEAPAPQTDTTGAEDILAALDPVEMAAEEPTLEDALAGLQSEDAPESETTAEDILADLDAVEVGEPDDLGTLLADVVDEAVPDDLDALLADLEAPETTSDAAVDDLDASLAELDEPSEDVAATDDLDALLADLEDADTNETPAEDGNASDDLDALLAELDDETPAAPPGDSGDDLDALMAGLDDTSETTGDAGDDLDALLAGLEDDEPTLEDTPTDAGDDLDALLAGLDDELPGATSPEDDLDALMAGLEDSPQSSTDGADDLDALIAGLEDEPASEAAQDLDGLLDEAETSEPAAKAPSEEPELAFGALSAERPEPQKLVRKRFRIAILGDFTGRAARGAIEVGDALAARPPIQLDPDTAEDVIEGFGTTLVLPIGKDGAGVEVKLGGLDDLHPDELYENVEVFSALRDLKSQLSNGGTADHAAKSLIAWGEAHGQAVVPASAVSGGNTVRADLKLSDFQKLIGDTKGTLAQPSAVDDLLARIVGPHIRKLPDPNVTAMAEAVDDALSGAMRMVLHHPEFQSVEAQWRAIDLIARSIETDDTLDVVLYDISAEEIAADLTQSDDLSESGFVKLLTEEPMDEEFGRGAYSAMIGMYTFEETPPHAQLLGRIARVAAHVDAPFFGAITPGFIETRKEDRHPLIASEWDTLRAMPEAGHLALVSPRFLMRRPYGAKTEPIYEFEFEEFTQSAGLSGMLWANPVTLVAILLAKSFRENGASMSLGTIMSLGDMPYHFVNDRHGDQVALPCTERNLTLDKAEVVLGRGYQPVISIKGRDEIRLGSFQSLAGGDILGPWSGVAPPDPSPPDPPKAAPEKATDGEDEDAVDDLDDLLAGFDLDAGGAEDSAGSDDDMDAELAALLADL